jgi:hypothetical protein
MPKLPSSRNGVVLYMVLVSILAAMVIASSILSIILSQARLSLHETNRVQAYYAALAGANYAIEKLRTGLIIRARTIPVRLMLTTVMQEDALLRILLFPILLIKQ